MSVSSVVGVMKKRRGELAGVYPLLSLTSALSSGHFCAVRGVLPFTPDRIANREK